MRVNKYLFLFCSVIFTKVAAQNKAIDVQHYCFAISLNDSNNIIHGNAGISFISKSVASTVYFDLAGVNESTGKGMNVLRVYENNEELKFYQADNRVDIIFDYPIPLNTKKEVHIVYEGIPADGLIIDTNKFTNRTFFGDNWPNRAHNWIPCNDHPADKASVEFIVTAPAHYQVISNGVLTEETNLPGRLKLTHWKEEMALPTKVMVIGAADFAVQLDSTINCVPITSWVFPENRENGFTQYAVAKDILPFLINYIGPFPYKKLANVQSKTIFGGMENASNIFYFQNSVFTGAAKSHASLEALFAHEISHQWFGDEVSEIDWPHLWLSEGFATYFAHLYVGYKYGEDSLKREMQNDRKKIIAFYKIRKTPVVDTSCGNDLMQLLNVNSYEKGSWVLNMLREKLGNAVFKKGIQTYYAAYKGRNASTDDFMRVMEKVSKQDLSIFSKQWLYNAGQPHIQGKWKYDLRKGILNITMKQIQNFVFQFPLQIAIEGNNKTIFKTIDFHKRNIDLIIPLKFIPKSIILDPGVGLLFEGNVEQEK